MDEPKFTDSANRSNHSLHGIESRNEFDSSSHVNSYTNGPRPSSGAQVARKPVSLGPESAQASLTEADHRRILRKMDVRLIPMLAVLYLLAFLDRKRSTERNTSVI